MQEEFSIEEFPKGVNAGKHSRHPTIRERKSFKASVAQTRDSPNTHKGSRGFHKVIHKIVLCILVICHLFHRKHLRWYHR